MRAQPGDMARIYCSEQNRHEPMIGTADQVDVWLLLEYRPLWKARAIDDNSLAAPARSWLDRSVAALAARGSRARPQFIRQPEHSGEELRLLVGMPGALLEFSGRGYDFLDAVDLDEVVQRPPSHRIVQAPHYLVCTNGQRDLCCARFGLPVYDGLRARVGARVWQTTHLGGHRFAPNVLTLPQGMVYGRVGADALDEFVATVEAGRVSFPHVRGRAWYPPAVQAAEALCRESDLTFLGLEGDDTAATVTFAGADGPRTVRVRRAESALTVLKSCADEQAKPVIPYRAD